MKSFITVVKEQISSFYLIQRLALYELKSTTNNNILGYLWEIINPLIQISIYIFVFGFGMRAGMTLDSDVPYVAWMLAGISLWFFVQPAILQGSKSIYTRIKIIAKMNFPMSVIPTYVIVSKLYYHLALLVPVIIILHFFGFKVSIYYLQLPYYLLSAIILLVAVSLITSTLATIVRDVQMVVQAVMRVMIYLTPLLWAPTMLPEWIQKFLKVNPLYYVVEGYRASLLGTSWYFIEQLEYTLYFWGLILVLLIIGSAIHVKFRNRFVDFL